MTSRARTPAMRLVAFLSGGALFGKATGFIRELQLAHILGASMVADGFRAATTAVLMPIGVLQNESVPAILIPLHREWQAQGRAPTELAAMAVALGSMAFVLMLAVQALGHVWVDLVVHGFSEEGQAQTLQFVRIMAFAMPASTLVNSLAAGELASGRARLAALRAPLLNLSLIAGLSIVATTGYVNALAFAFAFAFNALALWGLVSLTREGLLDFGGCQPRKIWASGVEFLRRSRPLFMLPLAEQAQVWLEQLAASRFAVGTVASLDYARTLTDSAVLVISQPVGLAVLSRGAAEDDRTVMEAIARPVLAAAVPGSIFLLAFAPDLVRLVFARGAFDETAVRLTADTLRGISFGLWAGTLGWILIRILNSKGQNVRAALILGAAYGTNAAVNVATASLAPLDHGSLMLGLGEALRNAVLLGGTVLALRCGRTFLRLALMAAPAAALMGLASLEIHDLLNGPVSRLAAGVLACGLCVGISALILVPAARRPVAAGWRRLRGGPS